MAHFRARDIVFIRGKNTSIVTGKIIEGSFRVGDCVQIPQPLDIHLSNFIVEIHFFTVLGDSGVIGLAFAFNSEAEKTAWKQLDLYDKEIEGIECS